jgi:uncharacterized protein
MLLNVKLSRVLVALFLVATAFVATVSMRAAYHELKSDFWPDHLPITFPADDDLKGLKVINLASAGEPPLTAFYRPSNNGRIVILLHGTLADRSQLLPEARMLARHGFGILSLDLPGHGESGGRIQWGKSERQAVNRAIAWAMQLPSAERQKVGLFGFSMGSWIALQVASQDQRVYAVALTGAFANAEKLIASQGGRWGILSSKFALLTARVHGMHYRERRSEHLIGQVSPRPVLLVAGSADRVVPASVSERLYQHAREPKSWWLVPGADHGEYATVAPAEYERRLVELFSTGMHDKDSRNTK